MWKPTRAIRNVINSGTAKNVTVYKDGVLIDCVEKVSVRGDKFHVQALYFCPGEIVFRSIDYGDADKADKCFAVRMEPESLLDGLDKIEVRYGSGSENTQKRNIRVTTIKIRTVSGAQWHFLCMPQLILGEIRALPDLDLEDWGWGNGDAKTTLQAMYEDMRYSSKYIKVLHQADAIFAKDKWGQSDH